MQRQRYQIEGAQLRDRSGEIVGEIVAMTVELRGGLKGGKEEQQQQQKKEGGVGETAPDPIAEAVELAWRRWVALRGPRRTTLPPGTEKQLRRALTAGYTVDQLDSMMQALIASAWHAERDLHRLSTIFATKPGGPTFEDQLDTWLARGEQLSSSPGAVSASDIAYEAISAAKATIHQTWGRDGSSATQMREAAAADLERRGIRVESDSHGRPYFTS